MTADALDPLIHVPARLQIMAALATLPEGDQLSFKRLQDMIELTPGNLITHLRKLEEAGYLATSQNGQRTGVTNLGRPDPQRAPRSRDLRHDTTRTADRSLNRPATPRSPLNSASLVQAKSEAGGHPNGPA